jgi:uncharacterized Ntn-hydrolase superfamily protein
VGVIASQAVANPAYGHDGLRLLREGLHPQTILERLVAQDPGASRRQVAVMDAQGHTAVHTGRDCVAAAGHAIGAECSAQGNMLAGPTVWPAMVQAFEAMTTGDLVDRLLAALDAAEREGGDLRGRQSAGLVVATGAASGLPRRDIEIDVRVDDHPDPVRELRRLADAARAHLRANRAMERLLANDPVAALVDLDACCAAHPDEATFLFRRALALLALDRRSEARDVMRGAQAIHPGWGELLLRFADAKVISTRREDLEALLR